MSNDYQPGITELRINAKAAISGINALAKRIEETEKKNSLHEAAISNLQGIINTQTEKVNTLLAKMYESGIR